MRKKSVLAIFLLITTGCNGVESAKVSVSGESSVAMVNRFYTEIALEKRTGSQPINEIMDPKPKPWSALHPTKITGISVDLCWGRDN